MTMVDLANDLMQGLSVRLGLETRLTQTWMDLRKGAAINGIQFEHDGYFAGCRGVQATLESPHDGRRYRVLLVPEETEVVLQEGGQ